MPSLVIVAPLALRRDALADTPVVCALAPYADLIVGRAARRHTGKIDHRGTFVARFERPFDFHRALQGRADRIEVGTVRHRNVNVCASERLRAVVDRRARKRTVRNRDLAVVHRRNRRREKADLFYNAGLTRTVDEITELERMEYDEHDARRKIRKRALERKANRQTGRRQNRRKRRRLDAENAQARQNDNDDNDIINQIADEFRKRGTLITANQTLEHAFRRQFLQSLGNPETHKE